MVLAGVLIINVVDVLVHFTGSVRRHGESWGRGWYCRLTRTYPVRPRLHMMHDSHPYQIFLERELEGKCQNKHWWLMRFVGQIRRIQNELDLPWPSVLKLDIASHFHFRMSYLNENVFGIQIRNCLISTHTSQFNSKGSLHQSVDIWPHWSCIKVQYPILNKAMGLFACFCLVWNNCFCDVPTARTENRFGICVRESWIANEPL